MFGNEYNQIGMEMFFINTDVQLFLSVSSCVTTYISIPRSEQETDHNFAEPGLFVINQDGNIQVIDIANNPFSRPELSTFVSGIKWIRNPKNNYPIRGTFK